MRGSPISCENGDPRVPKSYENRDPGLHFHMTPGALTYVHTYSVVIESNTDKANALNSFFHGCFNYNFSPLTDFPDTLEWNLPAKNRP